MLNNHWIKNTTMTINKNTNDKILAEQGSKKIKITSFAKNNPMTFTLESLKNEALTPAILSPTSVVLSPAINEGSKRKTPNTKMQELIDYCRIEVGGTLLPPPVAMHIMGNEQPTILFTKGNFSIITGPPKSRKSFLISMLMAASTDGNFQDFFHCPGGGINLLFDTEQARYKTQQITGRISKISTLANSANLHVYSLRTLEPAERIALIESVLESTPGINFVAIDGIIDLGIDPILQFEQAQMIVSKLMKWTQIYNIHITCVLHFNKNSTSLVGHLGSISHRKAEAIIKVSKCKINSSISIVEPVDCREEEFQPFAFSVDQDGLPHVVKNHTLGKRIQKGKIESTKPKSFTPCQLDCDTHEHILKEAFKVDKEHAYAGICRSIKNSIESVTGKSIGDNKAKDFVTWYLSERKIERMEVPGKKALYTSVGDVDLNYLRIGLAEINLN